MNMPASRQRPRIGTRGRVGIRPLKILQLYPSSPQPLDLTMPPRRIGGIEAHHRYAGPIVFFPRKNISRIPRE